MKNKPKLIAFYLPQYHPIPENDVWWEPGFTEWTNVAKAKPLFRGHEQPKIPADLGFYDLRVPEVREQQAELAKEAGIDGFCYWHYWFGGGKRLLERPFNEVLVSGKPNFPFCLGWANHSWEKKTWVPGKDNTVLIKQTYDNQDYKDHFNAMLPAFKDNRYIRINNKLLFLIWEPSGLPNIKEFIDLWRGLAKENNLPDFHFTAFSFKRKGTDIFLQHGFDSVSFDLIIEAAGDNLHNRILAKIKRTLLNLPRATEYENYVKYFLDNFKFSNKHQPVIIPNFDHSPRSGNRGIILMNSSPSKFITFLRKVSNEITKIDNNENFIFIKSWNEWGEGNYIEPDQKFGREYIEALRCYRNDER